MPANSETAPANEERLRAAIGPRADYYLDRWRAMAESGRKASWNWPACLFNVFWFAYRKMWWPMVAMGLAYVVTSPFLDLTHKMQFRITVLLLVGLSFVTGYFSNHLYRSQVERIVAESAGLDEAAAQAQAAARGGVSVPAVVAAVVVVGALSALAAMVPAMLGRAG